MSVASSRSAPVRSAPSWPFDVPRFQNRVIKEGDQVTVLIEVNGPGGYYTEVMRVYAVGKEPPQVLKDALAAGLAAQDMTANALVPGADPGELWHRFKDYCIKKRLLPAGALLRARARPVAGRPSDAAARRADEDPAEHEHRRTPGDGAAGGLLPVL